MEKNSDSLFEDQFGGMSYKDLQKLKKISFGIAQGLGALGLYMIIGPGSGWAIPVLTGSIGLDAMVFIAKDKRAAKYTTDIHEIDDLYTKVINDYVLMQEKFNLKNPVEHTALYNYLYKNGYLSLYKTFEHTHDNDLPKDVNQGYNILAGFGSSKNVSAFLTDILKEKNITAINAQVIRHNSNNYHTFVACDDGHYFCLIDPIRLLVYSKDKSNRFISPEGSICYYKHFPTMLQNLTPEETEARRVIEKSKKYGLRSNDELLSREKVYTLCKENQDIFDKFYKEHEELYQDVSNKLTRIRKIK